MIYGITPVAKPRMTQRDKWRKRPPVMKYRAFCDEIKLLGVYLPSSGAHVTFVLPMPKSWGVGKKMEMDGQPHQQKPDVDNLLKAIMDSVFSDDKHIWDIRGTKRWGIEGQIIIEEIE